MPKLVIQNLVDWGKSFVDANGSFYCGTTDEQKDVAAKVAASADLWIYLSDVHTRHSSEFLANGGLYPAHNLVRRDWHDLEKLGVGNGKTVSPELTDMLQEIVKGKPSGLIVPRHVFFQDYDGINTKPPFSYHDVEETFGVKRLDAARFLDGEVKYVINAKHMFNGAATQSTDWIGHVEGIPDREISAYTLLRQKYGKGSGLVINHTGVVTGICVYQTASGVRQIFPNAEINIIADGATHLLGPEFGFGNEKEAYDAMKGMCTQVGVNYITSREYIGR